MWVKLEYLVEVAASAPGQINVGAGPAVKPVFDNAEVPEYDLVGSCDGPLCDTVEGVQHKSTLFIRQAADCGPYWTGMSSTRTFSSGVPFSVTVPSIFHHRVLAYPQPVFV
jgi:hypothetical protein